LSSSGPRRDIFGRSERSVKRARLEGPFELELGGCLPEVEICWEEWGPSDAERAVLLFPSFSLSSHAKSTVEEPTAGWYEHFIGPRKAIDTDRFRIVCPATLGAPFGSTSPLSADPASGRPYGKAFPQITPFDMVRAARQLLEQLRVPRLHSVIGGSLGGNLALQVRNNRP
jgi:homoserine O-acetyltransferase